jgi:hypothetical protein
MSRISTAPKSAPRIRAEVANPSGGNLITLPLARLQRMLTGGLYLDPVDPSGRAYCTTEAAIVEVAAAQLRAIRFALMFAEHPDDCEHEDGRGWCSGDRFTRTDAATAIGGVMAMLQEAHAIGGEIERVLAESGGDQ